MPVNVGEDFQQLILAELRLASDMTKILRSTREEHTWLRKVYKYLIASTWRIGCTLEASKSGNTLVPKNWTTSTSALVEVTPCYADR